jgi:hypothetical protein
MEWLVAQLVAVQLEWDVALPAEVMVEKVWWQCLLCDAAAMRNGIRGAATVIRFVMT